MKQTTENWIALAEDDLLAAKALAGEVRLTNLVSFHCQQCIGKCFKAIIEEQDKPSIKSHDLLRLQLNAGVILSDSETILVRTINEVYIDSRYPGELGLLPNGKPTLSEADAFIQLCDNILLRLKELDHFTL